MDFDNYPAAMRKTRMAPVDDRKIGDPNPPEIKASGPLIIQPHFPSPRGYQAFAALLSRNETSAEHPAKEL